MTPPDLKGDDTLELIERINKGDVSALEPLLDLYIPQLRAFFKHLNVPNIYIDDLIQETFEKMLSNLEKFDDSKKFYSWLMTIGRNLYIDQYRRRVKGDEIMAAESAAVINSSNVDIESEAIGKISVEELLNILDDTERYIVDLRVFKRFSFGEIAEVTDTPEVTLRSKFFRAMKKLRRIV